MILAESYVEILKVNPCYVNQFHNSHRFMLCRTHILCTLLNGTICKYLQSQRYHTLGSCALERHERAQGADWVRLSDQWMDGPAFLVSQNPGSRKDELCLLQCVSNDVNMNDFLAGGVHE